jgi:hypothetical protein
VVAGDLLQALQALDVHLERLAPRARPAAAHRVRGLGQHGLDGADLDLVVVRLDGVHHVVGLAVAAGDLGADQRVAALDLVGERLADVVQHRAALEQQRVHAQLAGHHAREVRGLDQVAKDVLPVGGAVAQPAEEVDQFRVHVGDAQLDQRVLAGALAQLLDLGLAPLVGVLDPLRVDPAVGDQPVQGEPGDLAPHRVKAGEQDGLGRVVDDQVDAGHGLEGPDVAALAADDAALHLIARQVQDRDHGLAGLLGGDALDGQRDDLAGALVALGLGLVLDVPDDERRFPLGLVLDGGDQLGLGLVGGEAGDALEFALSFRVLLVELGGAALQVLLAAGQGLGALLNPLELLVQPLLAIGEAQLTALEVTAQLADLVLDRADLFFDVPAALGGLFGLVAGSFEDAGGFGLGAGPDVLGFLARLFELDGVLGRVETWRCRGPAPDDDQREHHREQPDHHERERQSAAHGHPFPSIALGAPLCCDVPVQGFMPWREPSHAAMGLPTVLRPSFLVTLRVWLLLLRWWLA